MTILGFPAAQLDMALLKPLMDGALDRIHASGACLAGGHSIENDALILGFSVTGIVPEHRAWLNSGARPGDHLILTKPLGTGTLASALKLNQAQEHWVQGAIQSMKTLNDLGPLPDVKVNASTDITGFSLAGHAMQMAQASEVSFHIDAHRLPVLQGAMSCLEDKILNRAHHTNLAYVQDATNANETPEPLKWLLTDPQTSGGLLLSVPGAQSTKLMSLLATGFSEARVIGEVKDKESLSVRFYDGKTQV